MRSFPLMVVAGTAQIGVVEERRLAVVFRRRLAALLSQERGDALAIERAELEGSGRDRFDVSLIDAPIRAQDAQAGPKSWFGMGPTGQHSDDQPFGARPDFAGPSAEPIRRPFGVASMRAGHVVGVCPVFWAQVTALVGAAALPAVEYLDGARGDPQIDFGADERMRDRIEEVMDLDVIVEIDARAAPFRELPIVGGQSGEGLALNLFEQLAAADAESAHRALVHALHD